MWADSAGAGLPGGCACERVAAWLGYRAAADTAALPPATHPRSTSRTPRRSTATRATRPSTATLGTPPRAASSTGTAATAAAMALRQPTGTHPRPPSPQRRCTCRPTRLRRPRRLRLRPRPPAGPSQWLPAAERCWSAARDVAAPAGARGPEEGPALQADHPPIDCLTPHDRPRHSGEGAPLPAHAAIYLAPTCALPCRAAAVYRAL